MSRLTQILEDSAQDHRFAPAIAAALEMIRSSSIEAEQISDGSKQFSKYIAKLYSNRMEMGYFARTPIGIEKSIEALAADEIQVGLAVLETDKGYIALWLDDNESLVGVMVFYFDPARIG